MPEFQNRGTNGPKIVHVYVSLKTLTKNSYDVYCVCCRIILGVNDLDVETVWRNTEGLIINWATYDTNQPDGTTGHGVGIQDCMQRQTTGLMDDTECNLGRHYYCEGKYVLSVHFKNIIVT